MTGTLPGWCDLFWPVRISSHNSGQPDPGREPGRGMRPERSTTASRIPTSGCADGWKLHPRRDGSRHAVSPQSTPGAVGPQLPTPRPVAARRDHLARRRYCVGDCASGVVSGGLRPRSRIVRTVRPRTMHPQSRQEGRKTRSFVGISPALRGPAGRRIARRARLMVALTEQEAWCSVRWCGSTGGGWA